MKHPHLIAIIGLLLSVINTTNAQQGDPAASTFTDGSFVLPVSAPSVPENTTSSNSAPEPTAPTTPVAPQQKIKQQPIPVTPAPQTQGLQTPEQPASTFTDGSFVLPVSAPSVPENTTFSTPAPETTPAAPQQKIQQQPIPVTPAPQTQEFQTPEQPNTTFTDGSFVLPVPTPENTVSQNPTYNNTTTQTSIEPAEEAYTPTTETPQLEQETPQEMLSDGGFVMPLPQTNTPQQTAPELTDAQPDLAPPSKRSQTATKETKDKTEEKQPRTLHFARGKKRKKKKTDPIPVWRDITPASANNSYQLLIDPVSVEQSPEHPRWRTANVRYLINQREYRQWRFTFSCQADTARVDEILTISNGIQTKEKIKRIYFFTIPEQGNDKWLRYAYNAACDD